MNYSIPVADKHTTKGIAGTVRSFTPLHHHLDGRSLRESGTVGRSVGRLVGCSGKIIPALVTTTAAVAGFACIELIKITQGLPIEAYKNICFNLALPLFATAEPGAVPFKTMHNDKKWTLWDRFELDGPLKLQQLVDYFQVCGGVGCRVDTKQTRERTLTRNR